MILDDLQETFNLTEDEMAQLPVADIEQDMMDAGYESAEKAIKKMRGEN
jgi:hypothetical protein